LVSGWGTGTESVSSGMEYRPVATRAGKYLAANVS
jgi:hypothetical protein